MARIRLPYVQEFKDQYKRRFYFRRAGCKRVPLPGLPGSEEFMEAYQAALDDALRSSSRSEQAAPCRARSTPRSSRSTRAHTFTKNKPITQATDRNIFEAFRAKHGDKRIALMERRHIEAMIAEKAGKPSAQRNLLRALRVLLDFAVEARVRRDNPALGIKLEADQDQRLPFMDRGEAPPVRGAPPIGTKARLALALLLYTAQRRKDVVQLGPPQMRGGG